MIQTIARRRCALTNISSELLANSQGDAKKSLTHLHTILDNLDELGEIMTDMLQTQDAVEVYFFWLPDKSR